MKPKELRDKYHNEIEELNKANEQVLGEYLEIHERIEKLNEDLAKFEGQLQIASKVDIQQLSADLIGFIRAIYQDYDYLCYKVTEITQLIHSLQLNQRVILDRYPEFDEIKGLKEKFEDFSEIKNIMKNYQKHIPFLEKLQKHVEFREKQKQQDDSDKKKEKTKNIKQVLKLDEVKEIHRIYELNKQLLDVLHRISFKLVDFAEKYNYPIPFDISNLLTKSQNLIQELNYPTKINKQCSICNKLNPENAEYCCYCGSSMVITRMRQSDKSPDNATEDYHWFCKIYVKSKIFFLTNPSR